MAGGDWSKAVELAVARLVARNGDANFTRQELIDQELDRIVRETGSRGATPEMTLSRVLQQMRDRGGIAFVTPGHYRSQAGAVLLPRAMPGKCVFVIGSHSIYEDEPDRFYRFPQRWLNAAARSVGQWIVYQEPRRAGPRGYYAVAQVEQIVRDPAEPTMYLALIKPGSFLELGHDVPFRVSGQAVESGLLDNGKLNNGRAVQSIRPISDVDFSRIVDLGLIDADEVPPPREDEEEPDFNGVREEAWLGPVERETALVSRAIRDRQFRKRVLDVYDRRCALTGMQLINGGGRAETQAAHVMGVEHGGPDTVTNGIALSGTAHWMFDRGLIALTDEGKILLSHKINDLESVTKLLHADGRARLPANDALRPHPRFLAWHRQWHQFVA